MIVLLLSISPWIEPSWRTAPSVFSVPSKFVRSPIRLSTSTPSLTALRVRRDVGSPTFTSPADGRKLGPDDPGTAGGAGATALLVVSLTSGGTGAAGPSSRSLDNAPRNRVHSCSSDFLNIWLLLRGLSRLCRRARTQYRLLRRPLTVALCTPGMLTTPVANSTMPVGGSRSPMAAPVPPPRLESSL